MMCTSCRVRNLLHCLHLRQPASAPSQSGKEKSLMVMLVVTPQYTIWSRPRKCANLLDRMFVKQSLALARLLLHHLLLLQLQDHPEGLASQEGPVEAEMEVADLVEVVTSLMVMAMTEMVVQHPTVQVVLVVQVAVLEALDGQVAAAAAEDPGG